MPAPQARHESLAGRVRLTTRVLSSSLRREFLRFVAGSRMSAGASVFTGGCLCGKVRYELRRKFLTGVNCYCQMCRKAHGTAFLREEQNARAKRIMPLRGKTSDENLTDSVSCPSRKHTQRKASERLSEPLRDFQRWPVGHPGLVEQI